MIHFITGKPGAGKSFYAVKQLVWELEHSERYICTNLPLNLDEIAEYCHLHIKKPVDLNNRLRLLTHEEANKFWLYEPGSDYLKRISIGRDGKQNLITAPDFSDREKTSPGCLYIIDEVHILFNARKWQTVSEDCEFFLSQHRHLRCDCLFVTQHPDKVDKNFKRNAQDFTFITNYETFRLPFGVSLPSTLRRNTYQDYPVMRGDVPSESGFFKLDISRYGKLYNSNAGIGLTGRLDVERKRKGRSPLIWLIPIIIIILIAVYLPKGLGWISGKTVSGLTKGVTQGFKQEIENRTGAGTKAPQTPAPTLPVEGFPSQTINGTNVPVRVTSATLRYPGIWHVRLSDGSFYRTGDPELLQIDKERCVIAGKGRFAF